MSETATEYQRGVPSFDDVDELREAMQAKAAFINRDLYPRDGSNALGDVEAQLAMLVGVNEHEVLAYGSGMSAVTGAIDIATHVSEKQRPYIACAQESYSQTKRYITNFLTPYRAKVAYFDSGDADQLAEKLGQPDLDVLVCETVGNYQNVPVLDVKRLLDTVRQTKDGPVVVLDNTLPLSTGMPIGELLTAEDKIIVVESGTKSYSFNDDTLGVAYSKSDELLQWLRRYRRTRGDLLGSRSQEEILELLPSCREVFDERNSKLFKSTGEIALALYGALQQAGDERLVIAHPSLPNHQNADIYAEQYPNGGAPVLYVSCTPRAGMDQYELTEKLWSNPSVREQARLGQSFGFDEARIIYDENLAMVRIAGGADIDGTALGEACAEALLDN